MRDLVSAGDARSQLQAEIRHLTKEERQRLLVDAGFTLDIPPGQGLAMKADLGIPWNKLRTIRRQGYLHVQGTIIQGFELHRWLKEWGLSMSSEKKQRVAAHQLIGDNLEAESIPLTFPLKRGEEVRAAAVCYVPHMVDKVVSLLEENEKYTLCMVL